MTEKPKGCAAEDPHAQRFMFVMNVKRLKDANNFDLAPDCQLRRATAGEIATIKRTLPGLGTPGKEIWEPQSIGPDGVVTASPCDEWRYFVITFNGYDTITHLQTAFDLVPCELEVAFTVTKFMNGQSVAWNGDRLFHVLNNATWNDSFFVDVSSTEIEEIRTVHSQLLKHDDRLVDVARLALQVSQLKMLNHDSHLRFLGYFAVLESLLTHAPKPSDPYDSITRQVKKKVALLDHRFVRPIDYAAFGEVPADAIWTKMYAYRSLVAHGGDPEFSGDLQLLRDHRSALSLIKETVKSVIRQALVEPQLLLDLKGC